MDNFVDERDQKLIAQDRITFFVLGRVMQQPCELLLSDHEKLILCFTSQPYPVWIWTPDNSSEEEKERAYLLAKEQGLLRGEHYFNMKYELADYFKKREAKEGREMVLKRNLFAYDCPEIFPPKITCDGKPVKATMEDQELLADFLAAMTTETGIEGSEERARERDMDRVKEFIEDGRCYLWQNDDGKIVGCCKYQPTGNLASLGFVYVVPEFRRMHYAQNMVYQVTVKAAEEGFMPMLYTDADYLASNSCYEKIGYILRGRLCAIGF